ncbi:hypothetical protein FNF31_00364 [Cafeteria roenbergensis]|uniref:Uncharacterized protein n=1 Tax=Cafeteria roenbergensis TaxID=33653 RepID=A0A5A8DSQ6_CAFRO|nr:hypothetical protein FNF28_03079 [Cafeteria roenbergensis]KAA0168482.1 hypothetical protein FNF31_00364 [Cafeteria roenbergensis]
MQCEGEFTVAKFTIPEPDAEYEGRKVFIGGVSSAWNLGLVRRGLEELFGDIIEFRQRPLRPESKTGSAIAVFAELASAAAAVATRLLCPGAADPPSPDVVRALSFAGCGRVWRVRDMRLVFPGREARPRCEAAPPAGDDERDPGPHWWLGGGW